MSDENTGGEGQGFTPPATQEELNRIISDRIDRERKKFADYDDLKQKASEFDQLSESKKSDEQKTNDRISALESELTNARFAAERARIQAKHSISDTDAELFLTATDTEKLEAQAKALADRVSDRKKNGPVVPAQKGREQNDGDDELREATRQLFKRD
ncbi:MAG: hypothetical protein ACTIJ6_05360 [Leucobacter sp.]